MKKLGKSYEVHTYEGCRTRFHVSQAGAGGAQPQGRAGTWPVALQFFKKNWSS